MRIRQRIVGALPAQMSLPFALWTRRAIQALVKAQFNVALSDRLVGKYLARWGCTAQRSLKLFLIVDNLRVHYAKRVRQWAEPLKDQIELFHLSPYTPESNPDEYLNHDFKTSRCLAPASDNDLLRKAQRNMQRIAQIPGRIQSYFRYPMAAYAAWTGYLRA